MNVVEPQSVIVIGGGIVGSLAAYELARAGWRVDVVDPKTEPNASYGNAGMLALSYALPMSNPKALAAGARSVLTGGRDVELARPITMGTVSWLGRFAWESRPRRAIRVAATIHSMARRSIELYDEFEQREAVALGLRRTGWLYVARTAAALRSQAHLAASVVEVGVRSTLLDAQGVRAYEPAIEGDVLGGVFYPDDISMNPGQITSIVRAAAHSRGVHFHSESVTAAKLDRSGSVQSVTTDQGNRLLASQFVIATGAQSNHTAALFGARIPVEAGTGWSIVLPASTSIASRALMGLEDHVVVNPSHSEIRLTGGIRFGGKERTTAEPGDLERLYEAGARLIPSIRELPLSEATTKIASRPMTANGLPIIERIGKNISAVTGHGTLGMTLAPYTAIRVREMLSLAH